MEAIMFYARQCNYRVGLEKFIDVIINISNSYMSLETFHHQLEKGNIKL